MDRNLKLLYLVNILGCFRFYSPIMAIYFSQVTGSYTLAMTIIGFDSLFRAILEVPTGIYSDLVGRKKTMILCIASAMMTITCWAIGGNFWMLLLGSFFGGLAGALASGNNDALFYDTLKEHDQHEKFHHYYSKLGSFNLLAFGIASLLGGFFASISFQFVFWISLITLFISFVLSFFVHQPPSYKKPASPYLHLKESIQSFVRNPKIRLLSISNALSNGLTESTYQFAPVFVAGLWPLWAVGVMRSMTNFFNSLSYYVSGRVIERFGALKALMAQFSLSRIILFLAYLFPSKLSPLLMASTSLVYGIGQVSQQTLLQREFSDHQRATMGSLDSLLGSIAFATISVLIGLFADLIGPRNLLLLAEILLMPVILIYWRLFVHHKNSTHI